MDHYKINTENAAIPSIVNEVVFVDRASEFANYSTVTKTIESNLNIIEVEDIKKGWTNFIHWRNRPICK